MNMASLNSEPIYPTAYFISQQDIEGQYIITDINFARKLFKTGNKISKIEIKLKDSKLIPEVKKELSDFTDTTYRLEDKYELNDTIHATVEVKNTGKYTGKEVVQLYVRDKASTYVTPVKQLRDFKKIELAPGETRTVQLQVPISDLYLVDEKNQRFVEAGEFILEVGQASNNIILSKTIVAGEPSTIGNDEIVKPKNKKSSRQMEVKGEVRDVQATLVPDMQIIEKSTGKTIAVTDAKGQFKFTTGNHEYLIFKKSGYQTVEIEVNNMNVINITVNYGEN